MPKNNLFLYNYNNLFNLVKIIKNYNTFFNLKKIFKFLLIFIFFS